MNLFELSTLIPLFVVGSIAVVALIGLNMFAPSSKK